MRITGGKARGIPLKVGKQSAARPATDRLREAVFSSLGPLVEGARFIDLFAGSGAYGLEAWSRGASGGFFIEKNSAQARMIGENVRAVGRSLGAPTGAVEIVVADATRWAPAGGVKADLIFVDPPYEAIPELAPLLFAKFEDWIAPGGVVVFEMPGGVEIEPEGWSCFKRLGKSGRHQPGCCFFRRSAPNS